MTDRTQPSPAVPEPPGAPPALKAYHAPVLEAYGEVTELTRADFFGAPTDNGEPPSTYIYTSFPG